MNKKLFMTLSHTWGIIMILIGYMVMFVLKVMKVSSKKYGWCYHYSIGKNWGGVSLGRVIITDNNTDEHILNHEHGHAIQNAVFGIFFPFIVAIPSAIRYHYRNSWKKKGIEPTTEYDDIWFESQATTWGNEYINKIGQEEKKSARQ